MDTIKVISPVQGDKTYNYEAKDCTVEITSTEVIQDFEADGVKITGQNLVKTVIETFPYRQMLEEEAKLTETNNKLQAEINQNQIRLDKIAGQKLEIEAKAAIALNEAK